LHVTARFATFAAGQEDDDFDPTTSPENSGKTRLKSRRSWPDRCDPGFDMAAGWLFHGHPV